MNREAPLFFLPNFCSCPFFFLHPTFYFFQESFPKHKGVFLRVLRLSPFLVTVANEGVEGSPTKNMIMLVVTATGQGDNPRYTLYFAFPKILSDRGPNNG